MDNFIGSLLELDPFHSGLMLVSITYPGIINLVFQLESHHNCDFDYVAIYDGPSEDSDLINSFCGDNLPPEILSTSNQLYVKFHSDFAVTNTGFRASYTQQGKNYISVCQMIMTLTLPIILGF